MRRKFDQVWNTVKVRKWQSKCEWSQTSAVSLDRVRFWDSWNFRIWPVVRLLNVEAIAVAINHSKTTTCFLCENAMTVITCFAKVFFTTQKHRLGMRLLWPVEQKQTGELKTQALRGHGKTHMKQHNKTSNVTETNLSLKTGDVTKDFLP